MTLPLRIKASDRRRLSADEEIDIARQIRAKEKRIEARLLDIPETAAIMSRRTKRKELTSSRHVDRMRESVTVIRRLRPRPSSALEVMGLWHETEEARWTLAMSGFRIAVGEARKMGGRGLDHEDLVNEGIVGLLDAAKRFDPNRKLRFSTYARWWVRARMIRAIDTTGATVRLPGGLLEKLRRLEMIKATLEKQYGCWDETSLADQIGMTVSEVRQVLRTNEETQVVSLVAPTNDDGNRSRVLEEFLSDESTVSADRLSEWNEMYEALRRVVSELPDRHRHVVSLYLGLDSDDPAKVPWTLQSAADQIGISRERVRQLLVAVRDRVWAEMSGKELPDLSVPDEVVLEVLGGPEGSTTRSICARLYGPAIRQDQLRAVEEALSNLEEKGVVEVQEDGDEAVWEIRAAG